MVLLLFLHDNQYYDPHPLYLHVSDVLKTPERLLERILAQLQELITQPGYQGKIGADRTGKSKTLP
jgi:hypothetical protein